MKIKILGFICLLVVLAILPYVLPVIHVNMIVEITFFSLFALSFSMLFGHGGLLSLGHSAYFGIGAYTVALLVKNDMGLPLLLTIFAGGVVGALGGLLAGFFCVRLKGAYFALLTMAFNQFFFAIALKWRSLTGGDDGISIKKLSLALPGIGPIAMNNVTNVYYFVIIIVIISILLLWYVTMTPFGNSARATKENDERSSFVGYNIFTTKLTLYTICSFFAGIAGSLFAFFQGFVSTSCIDTGMSMQVVFMTFIGGAGSLLGPIIGTGVYLYFTDWVSRITDRWEFILGVLFILLVMYLRTGLVGLFARSTLRGLLGSKRQI